MTRKLKIINVVGARPNFVKIAPFIKELRRHKGVISILVHTGQHYTSYMSDVFFKDFKLHKYICLNAGHDSPKKQIGEIQKKFTRVLLKERPDLVVVVGDVNSTRACALAASKAGIKVAHIEAGLRSFDRTMPEEINRIITDSVSDYLFITEPSAYRNLLDEGVAKEKIFFVGNIMIDSLVSHIKEAKERKVFAGLGLAKKQYAVLTLHRPSNVDHKSQLEKIIRLLYKIKEQVAVVYPAHPRAVKMFKQFGFWRELKKQPNLVLIEPLGYIDFLSLMIGSKFVITDSGGMQEETTYLGIPCFTLRKNTERPVTITKGTNMLIGNDYDRLLSLIKKTPSLQKPRRPKFWDGKTAPRIVKVIKKGLN